MSAVDKLTDIAVIGALVGGGFLAYELLGIIKKGGDEASTGWDYINGKPVPIATGGTFTNETFEQYLKDSSYSGGLTPMKDPVKAFAGMSPEQQKAMEDWYYSTNTQADRSKDIHSKYGYGTEAAKKATYDYFGLPYSPPAESPGYDPNDPWRSGLED